MFLFTCLSFLLLLIGVLVQVAFSTLLERKILAAIQRRRGPNYNGIFGLAQPIIDGLKLAMNTINVPKYANTIHFFFGPLIIFVASLLMWAMLSLSNDGAQLEIGTSLILFFAWSTLSVYCLFCSGWASNSKYALIGSIRALAQLVSYEVLFGVLVIWLSLVTGNLKISSFWVYGGWNMFVDPIMFIIFFIAIVAETNRHPFDLPEAESELVAGFNVEYSGIPFALFFLGEYSNILIYSALCAVIFC